MADKQVLVARVLFVERMARRGRPALLIITVDVNYLTLLNFLRPISQSRSSRRKRIPESRKSLQVTLISCDRRQPVQVDIAHVKPLEAAGVISMEETSDAIASIADELEFAILEASGSSG